MAIPVQRFEPMTWQQANPYTAGMAESANLVKQLQQNRFLAPQLRAQLEEQLLKNKITGVQAEYAPQTTQSDIMLKQGQAEQALANAEYMPLTAAGKFYQGAGDYLRGGYYNNPAMRLKMMLSSMPEADRAAWIAKNGSTMEGMLDSLAQGGAYGGVMPMPMVPQMQPRSFNIINPQTGKQVYEPGDMNMRAPMGNAQMMQAPQRMPVRQQLQQPQLPPQMPRPMPQQMAPQQAMPQPIASQQQGFNPVNEAFKSTANKMQSSPQMWERWQAAQAAEQFVNSPESLEAFNTLAKYSGALGKGKEKLAKYLNADQFADIESAENQFRLGMSGAIGQLEGFGKTDTSLNEGLKYFTLAQSNLQGDKPNYDAALKYYQKGLDFLRTKERSLYSATHPLFDEQDRNPTPQLNLQKQLENKAPQGQVTVEIGGKQYRAPADKLDELTKQYGAKVVG